MNCFCQLLNALSSSKGIIPTIGGYKRKSTTENSMRVKRPNNKFANKVMQAMTPMKASKKLNAQRL